MHRIMTVPQTTFARVTERFGRLAWRATGAALVLALLLSLAPPPALAQVESSSLGVIVSVNGTERRKAPEGKKVKTIAISDPTRVAVVPTTPEEYIIQGIGAGISKVTITFTDDTKETFEIVVVQFDIRQLENVLRRALPAANIRPVPAGNNAVILQGTVDRTEDLPLALQAAQSVVGGAQIINALRVGGVQQVQLDVVVAQVQRTEFRNMAFDFLGIENSTIFTSTTGNTVIPNLASVLQVGGPNTGTLTPLFGVNRPNFSVSVINPASGYQAFLQALKTEGLLKLIAEPRLVAQSGRQASFLSGGEQAVPVPAGLGQVGVQFEEFGTRLNFIPVVLGNGKIHLEVEPEVSDLSVANGTAIQGTVVPGRTTQRVRTTVDLEAGQTFVIGGLIQHSVNASITKAPILGELPFFGALFSSKSYQELETEVVILVTPHLVDGMACDQYPKVLPGQETRSPDDFELFLEGILEAPRGPREVCHGKTYVPAYKNGPTASQFPCGDNSGWGGGHGGHGGLRGRIGCKNGSCVSGVPVQNGPIQTPQTANKGEMVPMPSAPQPISIREVDSLPQTEAIGTMPLPSPAQVTPASLPPLESPMLPEK